MKGSWRTTVLGWLALIAAVVAGGSALLDDDPNTTVNFQEIAAALTGVGLIAARDNKVSSESAGAK